MPGRRRRATSSKSAASSRSARAQRQPDERVDEHGRGAAAPARPSRSPRRRSRARGSGCGCSPSPSARRHRARSGTRACRRTSGSARSCRPSSQPYDPPPYTFERFLEDELNEKPRPLPMARPLTPRDQQCDGADVVAAHAAAGGRVFLLGDDPGVGKTGTAILAVKAIAEQRDVRTVLVVADRPAAITIPHWARSIAGFGDGGLRWCVTTWDRLAKVSKLSLRRRRRRRGAHGAAHDDAAVEALEGGLRRRAGQGRALRAGRHRDARAHPARAPVPRAAVRRPPRRGHPRVGRPAEEAGRLRVPRGTWPLRLGLDRGRRRAPRGPRPPAGLARRRRPAGPAAPPGAVGSGLGHRHAGRADAGRAGRLRLRVVGVPRGDAARPPRPAEREGPGRADAVPAEGRPDPRAGDRRLGEGAGRGRAPGRGVGGVRRDGGRPDPRGAAGRRDAGRRASTGATGSTSRPSGCGSSAARRRSASSP